MKRKRKRDILYVPLSIAMAVVVVWLMVWSSRQTPASASDYRAISLSGELSRKSQPRSSRDLAGKDLTVREIGSDIKSPDSKNLDPTQNPKTGNECDFRTHGNLELPNVVENDSMLYNEHGRYTLQYSPHKRSALWVAYKLTLSDTQGKAGRSSGFHMEPELAKRGYAVSKNEDYKNSGFDKGHLLPSADRQMSKVENRATFSLANCTPQCQRLNRLTWRYLEERTRKMCHDFDTIYVVVGALFDGTDRRLGKSDIAIPSGYYKVMLGRRSDFFESFAYLMPNEEDVSPDMEWYGVTLDYVENMTGIDFFPKVPRDRVF